VMPSLSHLLLNFLELRAHAVRRVFRLIWNCPPLLVPQIKG